ncbi:MAG: molybdopterin molybdotransferase MoeA [Coriobacteriales bacterium]|jgi:molybdopterin molybdotransferase|nr:molybdopterin molybdotransferase MoeA [Coriobacteriales bacterium]
MDQTDRSSALINVEDARTTVLSHMALMPAEQLGIIEGFGRILAQDIVSDMDISPFDNTAMDGFAVRFADFEGAGNSVNEQSPLTLNIVGVIGAGEVYRDTLQPGEALRIMTGAPLPTGADTVVKIEDTVVIGESASCPEGRQVCFSRMPKHGEHVRSKGEEARKGDVLLRVGERINSPAAGLLASTGNATVPVYRKPRVAIISTGNELVDVTAIPGPGQIRSSNSYSLAAATIEAGGIPVIMPIVGDTYEALRDALANATAAHDLIVTSGGAAAGDFDFITPVVQELGELFFNKVNMKPGKAQTFGIIKGTPFFGLPGNPGAASVGFELLVRPALRKMQGIASLDRPVTKALLTQPVKNRDETRRLYLRAQLERDKDGSYRVTPQPNQSSALLGALKRSNCLMIVPEASGSLEAGTLMDCLRLDMEEGAV